MNIRTYAFYAISLILASSFFLLNGCGNVTGDKETPAYTYITGRLDNVTQVSPEVSPVVEAYYRSGDAPSSHLAVKLCVTTFYNGTNTFEVILVPKNSTVYILGRQHDAAGSSSSYSYAYNRIDVADDPATVIVTFESPTTIDATCSPLTGFTMYSYNVYISRDNKFLLQVIGMGGGSLGNTFSIEKLPRLLSGDSYIVALSERNASEDALEKYFYNMSDGTVPFDMSTPEAPDTSFIVFPPDGTTFTTGNPTFEWQDIPWADNYVLWFYTADMASSKWMTSTTECKLEMPASVKSSFGSGDFRFQIEAQKSGTIESYFFTNSVLPKFTISP